MRQLLKIKRLSKSPLNKKLVVDCPLSKSMLAAAVMCGIFGSVLKRLIKDYHIVHAANKPEE